MKREQIESLLKAAESLTENISSLKDEILGREYTEEVAFVPVVEERQAFVYIYGDAKSVSITAHNDWETVESSWIDMLNRSDVTDITALRDYINEYLVKRCDASPDDYHKWQAFLKSLE